MLYYRKKILLATLEAFGGSVGKLQFQKILFLIMEQFNKKYYQFVPYKYGCFSFESYNDKRTLEHAGYLLKKEKTWTINPKNFPSRKFMSQINLEDKKSILDIKNEYMSITKNLLLKKMYSSYPYYAINSEIISQVSLSKEEKKNILNHKPTQIKKCIFTIGYEGRSIDEYLNILIKNNIKVLCDVRKNPLSRKYGFSKQSLQKVTNNLAIKYIHIPELGINSHLRKNLKTEKDYKQLFSIYKKQLLPKNRESLQDVMDLLKRYKRVALTCFELDSNMCHRHCVSASLKKSNPQLHIEHL